MSDVTQVAFQLGDDRLAELDDLVRQHEFASRAEALRAAVTEFLGRRRQLKIDAALAAGYGVTRPEPGEDRWADLSVEGLRSADLAW
jgi:Arc/MetJ-type ribon-helix-helix transcriptional regulator